MSLNRFGITSSPNTNSRFTSIAQTAAYHQLWYYSPVSRLRRLTAAGDVGSTVRRLYFIVLAAQTSLQNKKPLGLLGDSNGLIIHREVGGRQPYGRFPTVATHFSSRPN
jgi:hypothetical protein